MEENFNQAAVHEPTAGGTAPQSAPQQPQKLRRVGTFTFGLLILVVGVVMLVQILVPSFDAFTVAKFAPAALVLLGVEILVYSARPNVKLKYDFLSVVMIFVISLGAGGLATLYDVWNNYGPSRDRAQERLRQQYATQAAQLLEGSEEVRYNISDLSCWVYFNHPTPDAATAEIQPGDEVGLYLTFNNDAYASPEAYAEACKAVMDACEQAGLPFSDYHFDTWENDYIELGVTYELNISGAWGSKASLESLAGQVTAAYWYDGQSFDTAQERDDYAARETAESRRSVLEEEYYATYGEYPDEDTLQQMLTATAESANAI